MQVITFVRFTTSRIHEISISNSWTFIRQYPIGMDRCSSSSYIRPPAKVFIRSFHTNHFKDHLLIIKDWLNTLTNIGSVDRSRTFARGLLTHLYGLNNSLTDSFGGSSLVANGGTLAAGGGYSFAVNQGPSLSNAISANDYSILLDFSLAASSASDGYKKIVDFKNLTSDNGAYTSLGKLNVYNTGSSGSTVVGNNNPIRVEVFDTF